jgi:hypothetical protein
MSNDITEELFDRHPDNEHSYPKARLLEEADLNQNACAVLVS